MFNNANVLYKTRFLDGVSTVTRLEQRRSVPAHRELPKLCKDNEERSETLANF